MDDDKLLRSLGALAGEQAREGEGSKWERLTKGELPPEDLGELERLAGEDPEVAALLAAARPLDPAAQDRITESLANRIGASGSAPASSIVRPARFRRPLAFATAGLSLAAGIALFVRMSSPEDLPSYALDSSGASSSRSLPATAPSGCVLRAGAEGSFELLARPADAVGGRPVAARAFVMREGGVVPVALGAEVSPKGSVRFTGEKSLLVGASDLRIVVGHEGELTPADALAKARAASGNASGRGWQVLRCAVETEGRAPLD